MIITCSRSQYGLATQAGHVAELEGFGAQILTETCWCSIAEPVIPKQTRVMMTNSGKYIHYGPELTGRRFRFGSIAMCVESACTGTADEAVPAWLAGTAHAAESVA
jgi:cis-L-3-hydroxyproline dehydratase